MPPLPEPDWLPHRAPWELMGMFESHKKHKCWLKLGFHKEKPWVVQDPSPGTGRPWAVQFHWQSHERHPYEAVVHHQDQGMWYLLKQAVLSLEPSGIDYNCHQHTNACLPPCKIPCAPWILWGDNGAVGALCLLGKSRPIFVHSLTPVLY